MVAAAPGRGLARAKPEPEIPVVVEPRSVEKTAEEKAAETAAADAGARRTMRALHFDEDGFVGAKDLAAKIDANEALKAALPEDMRNEIMANSRLAEFWREYARVLLPHPKRRRSSPRARNSSPG